MKKTLIALMLIACALATKAQIIKYNQNGKSYLKVKKAPTYYVIAEVAKYYKVQFVLKNTTKDRLMWEFSGTFPLDAGLCQIMEIIKANTDIKYVIADNKLLVGFPKKNS